MPSVIPVGRTDVSPAQVEVTIDATDGKPKATPKGKGKGKGESNWVHDHAKSNT